MRNRIIKALLVFCTAFFCMGLAACFNSQPRPTGLPHSITVLEAEHGYITVEKKTARKNEIVEFTQYPEDGYELYSLTVNGEKVYSSTKFTMLGEDVTIRPNFGEKHYWITYDTNRINGESIDGYGYPTMYEQFKMSESFDLATAKKEYYDFLGWYEKDNPETILTKLELGTKRDLHLYPKFEPIRYQIVYVTEEGVTHDNPTEYTVETENFTLTEPTWENHIFLGWYNTANFAQGTGLNEIDTSKAYNRTLYPKFATVQYDNENYRLINSWVDFEYVLANGEEHEGNYRLTADIDFGGRDIVVKKLSGIFDGGNHTVKGLAYSGRTGKTAIGLFGVIQNATVKNFTVEMSVDIECTQTYYTLDVGAIAQAVSGTNAIDNVHLRSSKFKIRAETNYNVGGILGSCNKTTTLTDCTVDGITIDVTGAEAGGAVGGLVGNGGQVERCSVRLGEEDYLYVRDGFTTEKFCAAVGGLMGEGYNSQVKDCYVYMEDGSFVGAFANKKIAGFAIGGLVGTGADLTNCYARVSKLYCDTINIIENIYVNMGGLIGSSYSMVKNCFVTAKSWLIFTLPTTVEATHMRDLALTYDIGYIGSSRTEEYYENVYTTARPIVNGDEQVNASYVNDDAFVPFASGMSTIYNAIENVWDKTVWNIPKPGEGLPTLQ